MHSSRQKIRFFLLGILGLSLISHSPYAASFEGAIYGPRKLKEPLNAFIWMDLNIPKDSGAFHGAYFYRNHGKAIPLSGRKRGASLTLTESNPKGKVTGTFDLKLTADEISGLWFAPKNPDTFQVTLFKSDPSIKSHAILPKLEDILSEEIMFYTHDGEDSSATLEYETSFLGGNLMSIWLTWENYSYTAHMGSRRYVYDLSSRSLVDLKDAFTEKGFQKLREKLQDAITSERESRGSDATWIQELYEGKELEDTAEALESLNGYFTLSEWPERAEFSLNRDSLIVSLDDVCQQSYSAGNRGATFNVAVGYSKAELRKMTKPNSVLKYWIKL